LSNYKNYEDYPNRFLVVVNKMDAIKEFANQTDNKKAENLLTNLEEYTKKQGNSGDIQDKYQKMSAEIKNLVHFVSSKKELMRIYMAKYISTDNEDLRQAWNSIFEIFCDDDEDLRTEKEFAEEDGTPFIQYFADTHLKSYSQNNDISKKLKTDIIRKITYQFDELIRVNQRQVNSIRQEIYETIESILSGNIPEKKKQEENKLDNSDDSISFEDYIAALRDLPLEFSKKFGAHLDLLEQKISQLQQIPKKNSPEKAPFVKIFEESFSTLQDLILEYVSDFSNVTNKSAKIKYCADDEPLLELLLILEFTGVVRKIIERNKITMILTLAIALDLYYNFQLLMDLKEEIPDCRNKCNLVINDERFEIPYIFLNQEKGSTPKDLLEKMKRSRMISELVVSGAHHQESTAGLMLIETFKNLYSTLVEAINTEMNGKINDDMKEKLKLVQEKISKDFEF